MNVRQLSRTQRKGNKYMKTVGAFHNLDRSCCHQRIFSDFNVFEIVGRKC